VTRIITKDGDGIPFIPAEKENVDPDVLNEIFATLTNSPTGGFDAWAQKIHKNT
jgi:hypothetical protein